MKKLMTMVVGLMVAAGIASAATTNDMTSGGSAIASGLQKVTIAVGECNLLNSRAATHAAFDVYKVILIPSNTLVRQVYFEVVTTNTGTAANLSVGDSAATNTYNAGITAIVGGFTQCTNVYQAAGNVKAYTADNFISLVPGVATTDGVFRVYAEMIPLRK